MKRALLIGTLAILPFVLASCADPYGASVKAGATIATAITGANQTVVSLAAGGLITPAEEINVLGYLKFANDADGAFLTCASAAQTGGSKAGSFTACAQTFSTALTSPSELTLIKVANPNAQTQIQTISQSIATGVSTLLAALGGR